MAIRLFKTTHGTKSKQFSNRLNFCVRIGRLIHGSAGRFFTQPSTVSILRTNAHFAIMRTWLMLSVGARCEIKSPARRMSIYYDWGFTGNPFEQTPLRADETGNSLLIGREKELKRLMSLIETGPRLPTVEGLNGVGKTSLVNVAAFRLMKASFEEPGRPLYIPCRRVFQLSRMAISASSSTPSISRSLKRLSTSKIFCLTAGTT